MDSLEPCKLNLESLILATAEKYLLQFSPAMAVPSIQPFTTISTISEVEVDMSVFPPRSTSAPGLVLRHRTRNIPRRRNSQTETYITRLLV